MMAVLPKDHPLAHRASYPLEAVEHETFIMPALGKDYDLVELFATEGITPSVAYSTIETFSALAMIENGLGMTVTNNLITENWQADVVKLPVDPPRQISMGILIPNKDELSPAAKKFVQYAKRLVHQEV